LEHLPEVLHMLLHKVVIDQNVVYVDDDEIIRPFPKNVIHESAKCGECISEPKRHHHIPFNNLPLQENEAVTFSLG
jgi:hypothetical protein